MFAPVEDPGLDGRLGRKKKTPEEMEAEANGELPPGATGGEGTLRYVTFIHYHRNTAHCCRFKALTYRTVQLINLRYFTRVILKSISVYSVMYTLFVYFATFPYCITVTTSVTSP